MKTSVKEAIVCSCTVGIFIALIFISWELWKLRCKLDYKVWYKMMVQETVREIVKSEALK